MSKDNSFDVENNDVVDKTADVQESKTVSNEVKEVTEVKSIKKAKELKAPKLGKASKEPKEKVAKAPAKKKSLFSNKKTVEKPKARNSKLFSGNKVTLDLETEGKSRRNKEKEEIARNIAESSKNRVVKGYKNFELVSVRVFKIISAKLDLAIESSKNANILSLVIAILLYLSLSGGFLPRVFVNQYSSGDIVSNVRVMAEYAEQTYEVEGLPEVVDVSFVGNMMALQSTLSQQAYYVYADLTNLGVGTHNVELEVRNLSANIKAIPNPSVVTVTIRQRENYSRQFEYEFINRDKMDSRFVVSQPVFDRNTVSVLASEHTMSQIVIYRAQIDLSNITEIGNYEIRATVFAYDINGDIVNVTFLPAVVTATIDVTAPSKTVPILIVPEGELFDETMAIDELSLAHNSVTIYGSEEALARIPEIRVGLDLTTISRTNSTYIAAISLPSGITASDVNRVELSVSLAPRASKVFAGVPVRYINNPQHLKPTAAQNTRGTVSVRLYGAQGRLDRLEVGDIDVYIDLSEYTEPGDYNAALRVAVPSDLTLSHEFIESNTIEITLSR